MGLGGGYTSGLGGRDRKGFLVVACVVVAVSLVTAGGVASYFFIKYRDLRHKVQPSEQSSVGQGLSEAEVVEKVDQLYNAPSEKPSIAQVNDHEKLSDQAFFDNAQKDDYVLVYPEAKVVILYRASTDKIINVGPIQIEKR